MRLKTLVYCVDAQEQILLGLKKRGFGQGKRNGFGGKVDMWETIAAAATRELLEEAWVVVSTWDLQQAGVLQFTWAEYPEWASEVHVFLAHYAWDFIETEEMLPQWFHISQIPWEQMWEDDSVRLPKVLAGEIIQAKWHFLGEGELESFELY